jgi:hypothetical protein
VRFFLPDDDVFQIDATKNPPVLKASSPHAGEFVAEPKSPRPRHAPDCHTTSGRGSLAAR